MREGTLWKFGDRFVDKEYEEFPMLYKAGDDPTDAPWGRDRVKTDLLHAYRLAELYTVMACIVMAYVVAACSYVLCNGTQIVMGHSQYSACVV